MADEHKFINVFDADITATLTKIKTIEEANRRMTIAMGKDFAEVSKVLGTTMEKVGNKTVNGKNIQEIQGLTTNLELVNGTIVSFNENLSKTAGKDTLTGTAKVLKKELSDTEKAFQSAIGTSSQLTTNFSNSADVSRKFQEQLKGFGPVTKTIGQNITEFGVNSSRMGQIVQTADGKFLQLTETTKKLPNGIQQVTRSVKDVTGQFTKTSVESLKAQKNFKSLGDNIYQLGKRALLTIPLWFLLRNAIMGVGRVLTQGLADIAAFDRALQKAKRNMQGSASEIEANFAKLREEVTKLSLQSGIAVEKITNAFQKFATVGFDFETSMAGANVATKLAVTLFGDAEENANALARAFRILSDNTTETGKKSVQLEEVGALLNNLWKDQAFEIDEIAGALERFAPIANVAGLSMKQTVQVLAALQTAGIRGTRAGRLLSTSVQQLDKNFLKISKTLGLEINPQTTTTLERFLAVNKAIGELNKVDKLKATEAIQELYGGVRGGEAPRALIAVGDILDDILKRTGDVAQFNKEFNDVTETIGVLTQRYHQANRELGKAIVTGLVGGDDFNRSLKILVENINSVIGPAQDFARILNSIFRMGATGFDLLTGQETIWETWSKNARTSIDKTLQAGINSADLAGADIAETLFSAFNKVLKGTATKGEVQDLLIQLTTFDADFLNIDTSIYDVMINKTQEILDNLKDAEDEQEKILNSAIELEPIYESIVNYINKQGENQGLVSSAILQINHDLKIQLNLYKSTEEQLNALLEIDQARKQEQLNVSSLIINSKLKELNSQGFLNSEILKAEENLRKQLGIQEKFEDKLERQLEIERSINDEKRLQSKLGSDSIKLFEIAQTQGVEVAREIGDVLSGNIDFSNFIGRGGQAAEIFKKEFSDVFKQQQALQFFKGDTVSGIAGLRGGAGIAIEETGIRGNLNNIDAILRNSQVQDKLRAEQKNISTKPFIESIVNLTNDFRIDASTIQEVKDQIEKSIADNLSKVGSVAYNGLTKALYGKQSTTL